MAEITWIKLKTDMFEHDKIKLIEALPDADTIIVIWVKLLAAAGKANSSGFIMLSENIPMNEEEMATIFNRPLNTVRLALQTFKRYGMIETENESIRIKNWENHQNIDGMERVKQLTKERVKRHREKKKALSLSAPEECNVTVTSRNATDIELDLELDKKRIDKDKEIKDILSCKQDFARESIEYLNLKANKRFNHKTPKTEGFLNARFDDGYTLDQVKQVIDKKVHDWANKKDMYSYLRPQTLFNPTNFEAYLNEGTAEDEKIRNGNGAAISPYAREGKYAGLENYRSGV